MLTVTDRAAEMLEQVRTANATSTDQAVRLTPDGKGGIGMTLDAPHRGDQVIRRGETPLVIVDSRVTALLDAVELDYKPDVDEQSNGQIGARFTLHPLAQGRAEAGF